MRFVTVENWSNAVHSVPWYSTVGLCVHTCEATRCIENGTYESLEWCHVELPIYFRTSDTSAQCIVFKHVSVGASAHSISVHANRHYCRLPLTHSRLTETNPHGWSYSIELGQLSWQTNFTEQVPLNNL